MSLTTCNYITFALFFSLSTITGAPWSFSSVRYTVGVSIFEFLKSLGQYSLLAYALLEHKPSPLNMNDLHITCGSSLAVALRPGGSQATIFAASQHL